MKTLLRTGTLFAAGLALAACSSAQEPPRPDGFVSITDSVPGIATEIRYFTDENFVGRPINGYEAPLCILSVEAAEAVASVPPVTPR